MDREGPLMTRSQRPRGPGAEGAAYGSPVLGDVRTPRPWVIDGAQRWVRGRQRARDCRFMSHAGKLGKHGNGMGCVLFSHIFPVLGTCKNGFDPPRASFFAKFVCFTNRQSRACCLPRTQGAAPSITHGRVATTVALPWANLCGAFSAGSGRGVVTGSSRVPRGTVFPMIKHPVGTRGVVVSCA